MKGVFIALEGPEGSGKSTQTFLLSEWLREGGRAVTQVREPGGTPVGEAIRSHVWVRPDLSIDATTELLLVSAARAALIQEVVAPALDEGRVVLADRFALSTLAYQGYGRGLALDTIRQITGLATGGIEPDLYVLLDLPEDAGTERQRVAGKVADRMEREGSDFLQRVSAGYRELATTEPGIAVVDGLGSVDEVQTCLRDVLIARLPGLFPA